MKLAQFWHFGHVSKSLVAKSTTAMNPNPERDGRLSRPVDTRGPGHAPHPLAGHPAARLPVAVPAAPREGRDGAERGRPRAGEVSGAGDQGRNSIELWKIFLKIFLRF